MDEGEYQIKKKEKIPGLFEPETKLESVLKLGIFNPSQSNFIKIAPENQSSYRWARLLYIGNLPDSFFESDLKTFLHVSLQKAAGLLEVGNPVS